MPSIIAAPVRTRNDKRGVSVEEIAEYVTAMNDVEGTTNLVVVDDSETDNYEKSYAKGERIRIAYMKEDGARKIKVVAFKNGEGKFVCAMTWKEQQVKAVPEVAVHTTSAVHGTPVA